MLLVCNSLRFQLNSGDIKRDTAHVQNNQTFQPMGRVHACVGRCDRLAVYFFHSFHRLHSEPQHLVDICVGSS